MNPRIPLFAANWKMNKLAREVAEFVPKFTTALSSLSSKCGRDFEVVLAPVSVYLGELVKAVGTQPIRVAAQNCGTAKSGAFTGEISPVMLKELGCHSVILGHSERRHVFKEDNALVQSRLKAALADGLTAILCVGEQLGERKAGKTFDVVKTQLEALKEVESEAMKRVVIAYEPVWAIGTGETATPAQAQEIHAFIRRWLGENLGPEVAGATRILYGGSAKADNAEALMKETDLDGLLVGTASLDPVAFAELVKNGLKSNVH